MLTSRLPLANYSTAYWWRSVSVLAPFLLTLFLCFELMRKERCRVLWNKIVYSADLIAIKEKYMRHIFLFLLLGQNKMIFFELWILRRGLFHIFEKEICFVGQGIWIAGHSVRDDLQTSLSRWTIGPVDHAAPEQDHFQMRWSDKLLQIQTDAANSSSDNITY